MSAKVAVAAVRRPAGGRRGAGVPGRERGPRGDGGGGVGRPGRGHCGGGALVPRRPGVPIPTAPRRLRRRRRCRHSVVAEEGEAAVLTLTARGYPIPQLTFYQGQRRLEPDHKYDIRSLPCTPAPIEVLLSAAGFDGAHTWSLVVRGARVSDSGQFSAVAANRMGQARAHLALSVVPAVRRAISCRISHCRIQYACRFRARPEAQSSRPRKPYPSGRMKFMTFRLSDCWELIVLFMGYLHLDLFQTIFAFLILSRHGRQAKTIHLELYKHKANDSKLKTHSNYSFFYNI